jgi:predicted alpha-1,2-mannosidase
VTITGPRAFQGGGSFFGGFSLGSYRLFFSARVNRSVHLTARGTSVVVSFDTRRLRGITLSIGVSFASTKSAAQRLNALPGFNATLRDARAQWQRVLDEIQVAGGTAAQRRVFATAVYHAHLMPHDLTGDGSWPAGTPHYEDFYTLWDTFRTQDPLLAVTEPHRLVAMINSLLTTYQITGWLPAARIATHNGVTQVGSNGDVLIADALVKGLRGIDYRTTYRALRKDADVNSPDSLRVGRVLRDWDRLHYVALDQISSASRTLEYAYDDFAVSEVAQRLGHSSQAARYRRRAGYWANLWDPATRSIRPRQPDGAFLDPFDPALLPTSYTGPFFEAAPLEYSTFVPQDVQGLIDHVGGDQAFVAWLNHVIACCEDISNEPGFRAPWLYIHPGRPDLTDLVVRRLLEGFSPAGLPGEDDSGALSAWYVWSAIGLYPNAGQAYYYIGAPLFTRSRIRLANGHTFTIDAPATSTTNCYVVAAQTDGRKLERAFLTSQEVERGGTLVLSLASAPTGWGIRQRPFSLSN